MVVMVVLPLGGHVTQKLLFLHKLYIQNYFDKLDT
jgi:hypothetical protein